MQVNPSHLKQFHEQGFAILKDGVTVSWQEKLKESASEIVANWSVAEEPRSIYYGTPLQKSVEGQAYLFESLERISCFFALLGDSPSPTRDDLRIIEIGHALHRCDPVFNSYAMSHEVAEIVRQLGYAKPLLIQSRYFMKPPDTPGVPPHQDAGIFYTDPISCLTLWIALEDATVQNGCVWAIPGSHKSGLRSRRVIDPESGLGVFIPLQGKDENCDADYVPLEVPAGGILLTHGGLMHRSYRNRSSSTRQALVLHFVESDVIFPSDNWFPAPTSRSALIL